ncbi:MAG: putative motility protein [Burkholderiales bacterium]|nr:putative motility protein [Burkholderiales bacterium]
MDGISNQIIAIAGQLQSARLAQNVQVYVLRQAMDMQQSSMQILLQPATGPQPLAISGSLGTRLNVLA